MINEVFKAADEVIAIQRDIIDTQNERIADLEKSIAGLKEIIEDYRRLY